MSKRTKQYVAGALSGIAITLIAAALLHSLSIRYVFSHHSVFSALVDVFLFGIIIVVIPLQASLWNAPNWLVMLMGLSVSLIYNATILAIVFRVAGHFVTERKLSYKPLI